MTAVYPANTLFSGGSHRRSVVVFLACVLALYLELCVLPSLI